MALTEGQLRRWNFAVEWYRTHGDDDTALVDATLAVDEYMRMLEVEVKRLRAECKWREVLDIMR